MLTIGHSNRPLPLFLEMLTAHGVELLVDIRSMPRSRHNPQFNKETLPEALQVAGIGYSHMPGLGGMRRPNRDSVNLGWRNLHFRGYADYMQTPEFQQNLAQLILFDRERRAAVMCAESLPWRCHRFLVADVLTAQGIPVFHIMSVTNAKPHVMTSFGHAIGNTVQYPAETLDLFPNA